ncbi:hypothetical protein H8959_010475 [Pygathrix nigripes]
MVLPLSVKLLNVSDSWNGQQRPLADVAAAGSTGPGPMRAPPHMDSTDPELEAYTPAPSVSGQGHDPRVGGPGSPAYTKVVKGPGLVSSSRQPSSGPRAGDRC